MVDPADADPLPKLELPGVPPAGIHPSHHFMSGNHRQPGWRGAPFDFEFGMADAADGDPETDLPRAGKGYRQLPLAERTVGLGQRNDTFEDHRLHVRSMS